MKIKIFDGTNWVELGGGNFDGNSDINFNGRYGVCFDGTTDNKIYFYDGCLWILINDATPIKLGANGVLGNITNISASLGPYESVDNITMQARALNLHLLDNLGNTPGYYNDTLKMYTSYDSTFLELEGNQTTLCLKGGYSSNTKKYGEVRCNNVAVVTGVVNNIHMYYTGTSTTKCNVTFTLRSTYQNNITSASSLMYSLYDAGHRSVETMLNASGSVSVSGTTHNVIGVYAPSRTASYIYMVYSNSSFGSSTVGVSISYVSVSTLLNGQYGTQFSTI